MSLCPHCVKVDLPTAFWKDVGHTQERPLDSLVEGSRSCDLCSAIMRVIDFQRALSPGVDTSEITFKLAIKGYAEALSQQSGEPIPRGGIARYGAVIAPINRLGLYLTRGNEGDVTLDVGIQLKAPDLAASSRSSLGRGRVIGEEIDYHKISGWLERCTQRHDSGCAPKKYHPGATPLVLRAIDVDNACLVDLPESNYAALSYVWGGVEQLRLLQGNFQSLRIPGALQSRLPEIPVTIRDAIALVKRLQLRYLWVDSLCIIQDDAADLQQQIPNMHLVYGCASVTIVAASGKDANAGLPGVSGTLRKVCPLDEVIQGVPIMAGLPFFHPSVHESVWETRGWTFQEKILSSRLLVFTKDQAFYHCNSATWCEDAIWENDDPCIMMTLAVQLQTPYYQNTGLPSRNLKGVDKYFRLVSAYHARQLTKESDAINAFSGALSVVGHEMNTDFVWGLPRAFFNQAIQWQAQVHDPNSRREGFPSWSWVGWRASPVPGDLNWPGISGNHVETRSMVRWYRLETSGVLKELEIGSPVDQGHSLTGRDLGFELQGLPAAGQLLFFRAETARLSFDRTSPNNQNSFPRFGSRNYDFGFRRADGTIAAIGDIALKKDWVESLGDKLDFEFIILGKSKFRSLYNPEAVKETLDLMAIETRGRVSYRLQVPTSKVDLGWYSWICKETRLVILG